MGNGAADGDAASASGRRRCPKHPSQPPFTGFCSACLLDRLHATDLVLASSPRPLIPSLDLLELEPTEMTTRARRTTTLLHLFQQEDDHEQSKAVPSSTSQDPPPDLQRKRSLRQSCSDWIACCDTSAAAAANHSSFLPSRQSLDASCSAPAAAAAAADATTNGVALVERRTASLRFWASLTKPAGHLLNRSFSESSRSRYPHHHPSNGARSSSSSQSQAIRRNGSSLSLSSSTAMGSSEISLPDDSLAHHYCRPHLKKNRLRRSRSVHYSSPTSLTHAGLTP